MIEVTVKHHFSAGHRIIGLPGPGAKCTNLHGHTFGVEWTFRVEDIRAEQIEFASVKKVLRGWVDEKLDHGYVLHNEDQAVIEFLRSIGSKLYTMSEPPTTEAMAWMLANIAQAQLPDANLVSVLVTEGPNNEARWLK